MPKSRYQPRASSKPGPRLPGNKKPQGKAAQANPAAILRQLAGIIATVEPKALKPGAVKGSDYEVVLPALQRSFSLEPGGAQALYERYKVFIDIALGQLGARGGQIAAILPVIIALIGQFEKAKPAVVTPPTTPPVVLPDDLGDDDEPVTPPAGIVPGYASLGCQLSMFSWDKGRKTAFYNTAEYKQKVTGNGGAQMKGDKAHFNITPRDSAGREIATGDPRHPEPDERGYPWMRYEWEIDGQQQQDTDSDHFILSSIFSKNDSEHNYDQGCTPTLKLETTWGAGKGQARFRARIDAEHNGPHGTVYSPWVNWFVD